jgi:hypothetical protein
MMPIWDEEWEARDQAVLKRHEDSTTELVLSAECDKERSHGPQRTEGYQDSAARARLAATAPAMARLLLELEWAAGGSWGPSGDDSTNTNFACALCEGTRGEWVARSGTKYPAGHAPDCRWLAVMRAAGVRE